MSRQVTLHHNVAGVVKNDQISALKAHMQAVQMLLKHLTCTNQGNATQQAAKMPLHGNQLLYQVA